MIRAAFIGINKHKDSVIRELTGAVRDATAFWALVSDTSSEAQCELVTDNMATTEAIREIIHSLLKSASFDDIVVMAFSGHGTKTHRLVTYDTDSKSLGQTTIGMDELAEAFKTSAAKAILCVIDCCFSGAAPARVMEDTPIAKDISSPLDLLAGEGRILLAACNADEPAYESPVTRHGLLTAAVLDVLRNSGDNIDILAATGTILEKVRAAASQIGVTQTPVVLGHLIGGLRLPRLVPGKRFMEAFPDLKGARVSATIDDLRVFGIPEAVTKEWGERFTSGLNGLQLSAVNDYRILDGDSLLVVAPTSSGKTFIGEMAASRAIVESRKTVFLLPYKALTSEKHDEFQTLYGDRLGFRVIRCTGDYSDCAREFIKGQYDIALLTYEMFLNLAVSNPAVLTQIGLIVIDESQFITDPMRGISVELLLTFLLLAREREIKPQLIALSAVIGEINHFDEWLGCRSLISDHRPVPLIEGVIDRSGLFQFLGIDGQEKTRQLLQSHEIRVRKDKASAQDVIVPLTRQLLTGTNEKVIVFRNQRGSAEGCARYLAKDLSLLPAADALTSLPPGDLSSTSNSLRICLNGGTAFHNTNLTKEEKQVVERSYRSPNSPLRVLGATTTFLTFQVILESQFCPWVAANVWIARFV